MPYMKNVTSGVIIGPMADDSAEFRFLQAQRQGGGKANLPQWEQVPVEDAEAAGTIVDGKVAASVQALSDAVAAGVDAIVVVGTAPFAGTVAKVAYYPNAAVAGADTNSRTIEATKADGTIIASEALTAGVNLGVNAENDLTLSGTPANLAVNAGDRVEFRSLHVGTGIADPGGLIVVTFTRE